MTSGSFREELKAKSTAELIELALTYNFDDKEVDAGWDAIVVLHRRPTREVFESAKVLCRNDDPHKRAIGVVILAQLGYYLPTRPYVEETLELFFHLIDFEQDVEVLNAVGPGLGNISPEPRKVRPLLKLKNHLNPDVRFGATLGLLCEEDPLAIEALIELSSDEDEDVRDWATFGLGSQIDADTPEIREALFRRTIDSTDKGDAPGEGLVGLAKRHDERAFELILKRLEAGNAGNLIFEAAEYLADPRLSPALKKLRDVSKYSAYDRNRLEDAIAACTNHP